MEDNSLKAISNFYYIKDANQTATDIATEVVFKAQEHIYHLTRLNDFKYGHSNSSIRDSDPDIKVVREIIKRETLRHTYLMKNSFEYKDAIDAIEILYSKCITDLANSASNKIEVFMNITDDKEKL